MILKQLGILGILLLLGQSIFAQSPKTVEAYDLLTQGKLDSAEILTAEAMSSPDGMKDPLTWYIKSFIDKEKYKQTASDSIRRTAIAAAKKAKELDNANKLSTEVSAVMEYLANSYFNEAASDMTAERFKTAAEKYKRYLEVCPLMSDTVCDTKAIFYVGYCAYKSDDHETARKYLTESMHIGYPDPLVYYFLARSYYQTGETEVALNIIELGHLKYPKNVDILLSRINYYRSLRRFEESQKILTDILEVDPKNVDFIMLLALNYESLADEDSLRGGTAIDSAKAQYAKVLALDPENLQANFNLAILYYNEAVNIINNLDYDTEPTVLNNVQDRTEENFRKSLPYMRKAYMLNPKKKETIEGLSNIYKALNEPEKSQEMRQKLSQTD